MPALKKSGRYSGRSKPQSVSEIHASGLHVPYLDDDSGSLGTTEARRP